MKYYKRKYLTKLLGTAYLLSFFDILKFTATHEEVQPQLLQFTKFLLGIFIIGDRK